MSNYVDIRGGNQIAGGVMSFEAANTVTQFPNIPCREATVIAKRTNTDSIYLGASDMSSSAYLVQLNANESFTFTVSNVNIIYGMSAVAGGGVTIVAIQ